jgi:phage-related protein
MAKGPGGFSVGRVSIQVVPDTSKFREKLKAELEKAVKGMKVEIPVDVDAAKAVTQLKALDSILKKIDGRNINIGANVSSKGDLDKISKDLSKVGKSASEASSGFADIGRTGAIVLAVVVLLAPALALIATLIAGLPSLLFAFGAGAAAVALGMDGLKKAAKGFAPTVERLKASLSNTFEKQLTKPFLELNKLAPVLDKGLNSIAVSISGIIADLIKFVTTGQGMAQINDILQNTAKFFQALRPAFTDGFASIMMLASEASFLFGELAQTFNNFAARFRSTVAEVTGNGVLESALRNLNVVLDSLLNAFNEFFKAGLKAMTVLGGPIAVLFDGFTKLIVALMPVLTALSKLVFNALGEAFKQLAPVVEAITPALQTMGEILGQILTGALKALGPLLVVVGNILNQVFMKFFTAITPFIQPFIDFITLLAQILGNFLLAAFESLQPFLDSFFKFISDVLIAITPLLPMLLQLANEAFTALAQILQQVGPELLNLGETLFPQLLRIIKDLVPIAGDFLKAISDILPFLVDLAGIILDFVIPVMVSLLQTISEVWPSIRQIITGAVSFIQGLINIFLGIITLDWGRTWEGIKQVLSGAWDVIKGVTKLGIAAVLDFFIGLPTRILNALVGLPGSLFGSGKAMMQGLVDGIKAMGQTVVNSVMGVVNRVRDLLPFSPAKTGPFSGKGYTLYSGRAMMQDWAKGIEQGAPQAVAAMEAAAAQAQTGLDFAASVSSEGFGDLQGQIMSAMSGWEVVIDANGVTKLVNKTNQKNARR